MKKLLFLLFLFIPFAVGGQVIRCSPAYNKVQVGTTLLNGLVSYYNFEETSGDLLDQVGSNDLDTNNGVTTQQVGIIGDCYDLDGTDGTPPDGTYIGNMASIPSLKFTTGASVSVWIKSSQTGEYVRVIGQAQIPDWGYGITIEGGDDHAEWTIGDNVSTPKHVHVISTTDVTSGAWVHIVGTFDGTTSTLYVNGSSEGTPATWNHNIDCGTNDFGIGWINGTYSNNYDGLIDEIGLWDRALTSTEVTELYNSGAGKTHPF